MSDFSAYAGVDGYDSQVFMNTLQVMLISLVAEFDSCSFNEFLISLDGMLSNIPAGVAAGINFATQIADGWTNQDTSIYLAYNMILAGMEDDNNWEIFG